MKRIFLVLTLYLCFISSIFSKEFIAPHHDYSSVYSVHEFQQKLGLNQEQIDAVRNINTHYKQLYEKSNHDIAPLREQLEQLSSQPNPPYKKIEKVLKEMSDIRTTIHLNRLKQKDEIHRLLTPEQQETLKKMKEKAHKHKRY